MNNLFIILFLIAAACAKPKDDQQANRKSILIEELDFDIEFFDRIRISKDSSLIAGSFDSLTFFKNDKVVFTIKDRDGYDSLPNVFKGIKNLSSSRLIFITRLENQYLAGLFGFEYGCCPRKLTLLNIDMKGFHKILDEEFETKSIETIGDEKFLSGQKILGQCLTSIDSLGVNICAYCPLLIYKIGNELLLDSVRTKTWNESNYLFRGFEYDQDIWVATSNGNSKNKRQPYVYKEKGAESKR